MNEPKKSSVPIVLIIIGISFGIIALLFKLMHWNGIIILFSIAILLIAIGVLTYILRKKE